MKLINHKDQLINNIDTLEGYVTSEDAYSNDAAKSLIKRGTCFVNLVRFVCITGIRLRILSLTKTMSP